MRRQRAHGTGAQQAAPQLMQARPHQGGGRGNAATGRDRLPRTNGRQIAYTCRQFTSRQPAAELGSSEVLNFFFS